MHKCRTAAHIRVGFVAPVSSISTHNSDCCTSIVVLVPEQLPPPTPADTDTHNHADTLSVHIGPQAHSKLNWEGLLQIGKTRSYKNIHTHTHTYKHTQTPHTVIAYRQTNIIPYRTDKTVAFDMPIDWLNSKIW